MCARPGTQLARAAGNKNADKSQCLLYAPSPDASVAVKQSEIAPERSQLFGEITGPCPSQHGVRERLLPSTGGWKTINGCH